MIACSWCDCWVSVNVSVVVCQRRDRGGAFSRCQTVGILARLLCTQDQWCSCTRFVIFSHLSVKCVLLLYANYVFDIYRMAGDASLVDHDGFGYQTSSEWFLVAEPLLQWDLWPSKQSLRREKSCLSTCDALVEELAAANVVHISLCLCILLVFFTKDN